MNPELDDQRPGLKPPRFGLAALFVAVAVLGLMFAVIHYVGMLGSAIAILFLLCVAAHVVGNAIGTRLRDIGSQPTSDSKAPHGRRRFRDVMPSEFAPMSRLRERSSLGKRNIVITVCGAMIGGVLGGAALQWLSAGHSTWQIIGLGICASAVLGGIWTFAASSFIQVMLSAWFHASREPRKR